MDSFDTLVVNGVVVTASDIANYDIAIKDGKIALLAPPGLLDTSKAKKVIDAQGGYVTVSLLLLDRKFFQNVYYRHPCPSRRTRPVWRGRQEQRQLRDRCVRSSK